MSCMRIEYRSRAPSSGEQADMRVAWRGGVRRSPKIAVPRESSLSRRFARTHVPWIVRIHKS